MTKNCLYKNEKRLNTLKRRTKRCVCKYCGEKLNLKRIIFNDYEDARIEIFCSGCDRIEYGVEPAIYKSAEYFIENSDFVLYSDLDDNERTKQMTVAKLCEIMTWENQNLGFLSDDGFVVKLNVNENFSGKTLTFTEEDFDINDVEIEDFYVEDTRNLTTKKYRDE